jgi:hypothetical protein
VQKLIRQTTIRNTTSLPYLGKFADPCLAAFSGVALQANVRARSSVRGRETAPFTTAKRGPKWPTGKDDTE